MATWLDVINNPEFKKETPETQLKIRDDYFNKVIAPKVQAEGDNLDAVRSDFYAHSGLADIAPTQPAQAEDSQDPGLLSDFHQAMMGDAQGAGDVLAEAGRGVAQAGVNLANIPGWAVNKVLEAVGVPKEYFVKEVELPDSMKPQTEMGKLGAEIGGYMIPVGAPLKAAEGASKLAKGATALTNLARENVVGAAAQATEDDNFTENLLSGMAGSAIGGAALKGGEKIYRGITGKLSEEGVEAATNTAIDMLKTKSLYDADINIKTQLQEAEAAKRALSDPKSPTISEDLLKGNPVLSRVSDAGVDMSSKEGRKAAINLIDEDMNAFNQLSESLRREIDNADPNAYRLFNTIKRNEETSGGTDWSTNLSFSSPEFQKQLGMSALERGLLKAGSTVEDRLPFIGSKMSKGVSESRLAENKAIYDDLTSIRNDLEGTKILNSNDKELLNQLRQRVNEGSPTGKQFALTDTEKETYSKLLGKDERLDNSITRLYRMGNYASNTGLGSRGLNANTLLGSSAALMAGSALGGLGMLAGVGSQAMIPAAGAVLAKNVINQSYKRVLKAAGEKAEVLAKKGYTEGRITAIKEKMIRNELEKMFKDQGYGEQSKALAKAMSTLGQAGVLASEE